MSDPTKVIFNYLVGNNDAYGKNFSLLYRGIGTDDMQVSLLPLYDMVSTVYYPEICRAMAMGLGGEYSSEKVTHATSSSLPRKRDSPSR
jgi:serine/threonine-protein kinase HipA